MRAIKTFLIWFAVIFLIGVFAAILIPAFTGVHK